MKPCHVTVLSSDNPLLPCAVYDFENFERMAAIAAHHPDVTEEKPSLIGINVCFIDSDQAFEATIRMGHNFAWNFQDMVQKSLWLSAASIPDLAAFLSQIEFTVH